MSQYPGQPAEAQHKRAIYIPESYEPGYEYPVLVLMHGQGGDEFQLMRLMPFLSERNYVAISLRGPRKLNVRGDGTRGFGWGQVAKDSSDGEGIRSFYRPIVPSPNAVSTDMLDEYVMSSLDEAANRVSINLDQVYLIGYGEGATAALRLALGRPVSFAGVVSINGWLPRVQGPMLWLPQARKLRTFLVHGVRNRLVSPSLAYQAYRLLYTAGIETQLELVDGGHRIQHSVLSRINEWVMETISRQIDSVLV